MKKLTVKVTTNIYGNFRVMMTGLPTAQVGDFKFDAIAKVSDLLEANPTATLSPLSVVTMAEVEAFRTAIRR